MLSQTLMLVPAAERLAPETDPTSRPERGRISVFDGGRSSYTGSTYWANAIPSEVISSLAETSSLTT